MECRPRALPLQSLRQHTCFAPPHSAGVLHFHLGTVRPKPAPAESLDLGGGISETERRMTNPGPPDDPCARLRRYVRHRRRIPASRDEEPRHHGSGRRRGCVTTRSTTFKPEPAGSIKLNRRSANCTNTTRDPSGVHDG